MSILTDQASPLPFLTKNNHVEFQSEDSPDGRTFYIKVGSPGPVKASAFEIATQDARHYYESQKSAQLTLCLSGGIDSEAMCRSFLAAEVDFKVVFLRFQNNLNLFDIQTNIDFCTAKSIPFQFIDLDILHFFESGLFSEVAKKYECQSPQIATHLWLLDQIEGTPCLSGNPIVPIWKNESWFFMGLPGELHSTYFKYFLFNNRQGLPWFFIYSPELIKSFFSLACTQPYLQKKVTSPEAYTYLEKCQSYWEGGFQVRPRKDKFTGFELVRKHYDDKYHTSHGITFDEQFRRPLEKLFPYPDQYVQLIPAEYFQNA